MKYLLLVFALFVSQSAFAGSISININGVGETWELSPADQERFDGWILFNYRCASSPAAAMQRPYPALPIPLPPKNCPEAQTLDVARAAWVKAMLQGTLGNVIRGGNDRDEIGGSKPNPNPTGRRDLNPIMPVKQTKIQ